MTKKYNPFSSQAKTDLEQTESTDSASVITEQFPIYAAGGSTKYSVEILQQAIQAGHDFQIIPKGSSNIIVPAGAKGIIIHTEFNPGVKQKIDELTSELSAISVISTAEQAAAANKVLAKAKKVTNLLTAERKLMAATLKEEDANLINYERTISEGIQLAYEVVSKSVLSYQQKVHDEAKKKEEQERIEKEAKIKEIQAEADRKAEIQKYLFEFELSVLNAIQSATIDDIDSKIKSLTEYYPNITVDEFHEFLSDALNMWQKCVVKMNARKVELLEVQRLEKVNSQAANELKRQQNENLLASAVEIENKADGILAVLKDEQQSEISNVQMQSEFKGSMIATAKGVAVLWTFDEDTIDMSLLPDEYKTYNAKKIKEAVSAGCRSIPGVNIHDKLSNRPR